MDLPVNKALADYPVTDICDITNMADDDIASLKRKDAAQRDSSMRGQRVKMFRAFYHHNV
jgi:hypothetical protein